jgi:hypothetical protein
MTEREQFGEWMLNDEKCIVGSSDPYPAGIERRNWRVWHFAWQASRRAALEEVIAYLETERRFNSANAIRALAGDTET